MKLSAILIAAFIAASQTLSWDNLIEETRQNHPTLAAKQAVINALEELPDTHTALKNPMVMIGVMNLPTDTFGDFSQEPMTKKVIGVSQAIPAGAKRYAAKKVAETDVKIAKSVKEKNLKKMIVALKRSVYEIDYSNRSLEILEQNSYLLDDIATIATARYSTGKGSQANVIQAQLMRSRIDESKISFEKRRELAEIAFNRLVGRPGFSKVEIDSLPLDGQFSFDPTKFLEQAIVKNPDVVIAKEKLSKAYAELKKAAAATGSDITLSAEYGQRDDGPTPRTDFLSAKAAFTIPLWKSKKEDRVTAAKRFLVTESESLLEDAKQEAKAKLSSAVAKYKGADETINLYDKSLLAQARLAKRSARAAYQSEKVDFFTLISTEEMLLKLEMRRAKEILMRRIALSEIEYFTGGDKK